MDREMKPRRLKIAVLKGHKRVSSGGLGEGKGVWGAGGGNSVFNSKWRQDNILEVI